MADLTLRLTKGSALTLQELDSNFQALDSDVANLSSSLATSFVSLSNANIIYGFKNFRDGIEIVDSGNAGSIQVLNDGVTINGSKYPGNYGTDGQFLKTDGAGTLSFATVVSYDSAKVLGQIDSAAVTLTGTQSVSGAKTFTNTLTASNGAVLNGLTYPTADGAINQFITTNGSGVLSFATVESYDSAKVQGQIDSNAPFFLSSAATDAYTSGTLTFNSGTTLTAASGATVNFSNTTGTAPFTVASTTKVTNLNADRVDGFSGIGIYDSAGTLLNGA